MISTLIGPYLQLIFSLIKKNPINIACSCDVLVVAVTKERESGSCKHFNIQIIQYILYRQEK